MTSEAGSINSPNTIGKQQGKAHLWKLGLAQTILLALLGVIAIRLAYLQLLKKNELRRQARRQYESRIELKPRRGNILDRNNNYLATTALSYSYAVDPKIAAEPGHIAKIVAGITGDSVKIWEDRIRNCKTSFLWLLRGRQSPVPELEEMRRLGIIRINEPRRRYPFRDIGGQAIGAANIDNVGVSGIEIAVDSILRGKPGFAVMLRDGQGAIRSALDVPNAPPANGDNVTVTLDIQLQLIAAFELRQGIEAAQAVSGILIAIEPATGELRALCSYPSFDPGNTSELLSDATRIRGISDMYEPGSTFKIVAAAASLEEKLIKPSDSVDGENGTYRVGDLEIKDTHPLGKITFRQALEQSSNIVFAKQAMSIPDGTFYKYARDFGFGVVSGIDIPGEISGVLKKPRKFDNTTKMFMGYGYELSASALQIADAYSAIANGGVLMKPYIIKSVRSEDGAELYSAKPQVIRRVISRATADTLKDMLRGVVERGTGSEAKIYGLDVAGKTGTAQQVIDGVYSKKAYTASFAGFFPANSPKLVMVIMLDRPKTDIYGGKTAAPIFRRIAERWAGGNGVENIAKQVNPVTKTDSVVVPEARGLTIEDAEQLLHIHGLRLKCQNSGFVISQNVKPGMKVSRGSEVEVETVPVFNTSVGELSQGQKQGYIQPNVYGIPLRRALAILHNAGAAVRVHGKGKVVSQRWSAEHGLSCEITCDDR